MKLKSLFGVIVACGVMAVMAVAAHAETYSIGALQADGSGKVDGTGATSVSVPVVVTPDSDEAEVKVNGYIMTFTYDPSIVSPVAPEDNLDETDNICYATWDTSFVDPTTNPTVIVSDKIASTEAGKETLVVAWAAANPVTVTEAATMAVVNFNVVDTEAASAPVTVAVAELSNDGTSVDKTGLKAAQGVIDLNDKTTTIYYGDVTGDGVVNIEDVTALTMLVNDFGVDTVKAMYPNLNVEAGKLKNLTDDITIEDVTALSMIVNDFSIDQIKASYPDLTYTGSIN